MEKRVVNTKKKKTKREKEIEKKLNNEKRKSKKSFEDSIRGYPEKLAVNAARRYLTWYFPVIGDIYKAYRFSGYVYRYVILVEKEYKKTNNMEKAVLNASKKFFPEVVSDISKDVLLQHAVDMMWVEFKRSQNIEIANEAIEEVIKGAMYDTISEVLGVLYEGR